MTAQTAILLLGWHSLMLLCMPGIALPLRALYLANTNNAGQGAQQNTFTCTRRA